MSIRLIVGLGNPGPEYDATRHNAGFWFVDLLARAANAPFARERKFFGEVARARIGAHEVWLLKPQTYMNGSGKSVASLAGFHRIPPAQTLVAHDELDLPPGTARLKKGGGAGGHNGLKDIQSAWGADTWRLRIGIGHPRTLGLAQDVADFVLARPRREELPLIERTLPAAQAVVPLLLEGRFDQAMQLLHADPAAGAAPPRPKAAKPPRPAEVGVPAADAQVPAPGTQVPATGTGGPA